MWFREWVTNEEINNDKLTEKELNAKLIEEVTEVIEATFIYENKPNEEHLIHALEEILDVAQLMINRIRRLRRIARVETLNFENCFFIAKAKHDQKRKDRGWECGEYAYHIKRKLENNN